MSKALLFHSNNPFKWKHFKKDIILWCVRWYCRYALTYADLKEIAAERGLSIERSTICRWVHEYAPELNKRLKQHLKKTCDSWRLDETYVKIKGKWQYFYRAIDKNGQTIDWMLSRYRNKQAAKRFFKKAFNNPNVKPPRVINVDKNPAYVPAYNEMILEGRLLNESRLRQVKYLNNSVENDHKAIKRKSRYRQWYQSFTTARKTLDGMEIMRALQKGQLKYLVKGNVCAQNELINKVFGIVA